MEHIEKRRYSEMKRSGRRGGMGKGGGDRNPERMVM